MYINIYIYICIDNMIHMYIICVDCVLHDLLRPTAMLEALAAVGLDGEGATGGPQKELLR